mmetsp:Transcript_8868/g.26399  ORF Transcript_8868/g.26399 Transcript_8868/m.26399 type:complete len:384 (-) Transcript_8868:1225-2376(-)
MHVVLELADGAAGAAVAQPLEERLERLRRVGHVAKPEARAGVGGGEGDAERLDRHGLRRRARGAVGGGEAGKGLLQRAEDRVVALGRHHRVAEVAHVPERLHDHAEEAVELAARVEDPGGAALAPLLLAHHARERDRLRPRRARVWKLGRLRARRAAAAVRARPARRHREGLDRAGAAVGGVPALLLQLNVQAELLDLPGERLGLANLALPHEGDDVLDDGAHLPVVDPRLRLHHRHQQQPREGHLRVRGDVCERRHQLLADRELELLPQQVDRLLPLLERLEGGEERVAPAAARLSAHRMRGGEECGVPLDRGGSELVRVANHKGARLRAVLQQLREPLDARPRLRRRRRRGALRRLLPRGVGARLGLREEPVCGAVDVVPV